MTGTNPTKTGERGRIPARVLYVHHGKGIGGAPLSLLFLIRSLDRSRYEPTVLCIHESEAAELFRREGIETIVDTGITDFSHTNVLWYPWWQLPKIVHRLAMIPVSIRRMRAFLRSRPFELVHLNTSTLLACGIAAKREGVRVVWHIREPLSGGHTGLRRWFARRVIDACADRIVPICRYDGEQLIQTDRIHVVYNFVEFTRFDRSISGEAVRTELGIASEAPVVTMLGGVNRIKGTLVFAEAARIVLRERGDVRFLIAGEVPAKTFRSILNGTRRYAARVYSAAAEVPRDALRFIGVRRDIPELLAATSVLCFPSTVPHFARPAIEAAAMARPVIASDLGGPRELVLHDQTGLLVAPGDPRALADAILSLVNDPDRTQAMGEAGHRFAREHFDAATNARAVARIYDELLGNA